MNIDVSKKVCENPQPGAGGRAVAIPPYNLSLAIYGAVRSSIVPSRAPVAKSRTKSWRSPSGNTRSRIRRFEPAVIASIRAPRGISTAVGAKGRSLLAPGRSRDILLAIPATSTAKPTTIITPITTTRIFNARICLSRTTPCPHRAEKANREDG